MSAILNLNPSQDKILKSIAELQHDGFTGVSGYELTTNKSIANATWQKNYRDLEKRRLIKLVKIEGGRKKNSSKNRRQKKTYEITYLGCFALLKNLDSKESPDKIIQNIPRVKEIFSDLSKIFRNSNNDCGWLLYAVLIDSVKQVELELVSSKDSGLQKNAVIEILKITSTDQHGNSTTLEQNHWYLFKILEEKAQKPAKETKASTTSVPTIEDLENKILDTVIFLFFYNLLRLYSDQHYFAQIVLNSNLIAERCKEAGIKHDSIKPSKFRPTLDFQHMKNDLGVVSDAIRNVEVFVKTAENKIIAHIANPENKIDEEFHNRIMFINHCYQNRHTIIRINRLIQAKVNSSY